MSARDFLRNNACLFQRGVSAIFVDCLEGACRDFHDDELIQFRHPNAFLVKVWDELARRHRSDVLADAAFFLRQAAAVNFVAA